MRKYHVLFLTFLFCLPIVISANDQAQFITTPTSSVEYTDWDMCAEAGLKNLFKVLQNNPTYTVKLNEVICGASSIKRYLTRKGIASRRVRITGVASCSCYGTATDGSTQCAINDFVVYNGQRSAVDLYTLEQQLSVN